MLRNYLAAALRNLVRNRLYSAISVFCLAVGLCAATLAGVIIRNELTYEHFIHGYEQTYLASNVATPTGHEPLHDLGSPSFVAAVLKLNLPQIRAVTRIAAADVHLRHDQVQAQERLYWADPNAFELLRIPVFAGNLDAALNRPDGIVLTRSIAEKYFGRDDPVGQTILLDDEHVMTVMAIVNDLPLNGTALETGLFASGLASYSALSKCDREAPENAKRGAVKLCGRTYVQLAPQTNLDSLQRAVDAVLVGAYPKFPGMTMTVQLMRIDRAHLFEGVNPGVQARMAVIGAVALVILFTSCVVFVNLSTARSVRRAMEVGIRKTFGANRAEIIVQFLGESLLYVVLAACFGLALADLVLPYANAFLNSAGHLDLQSDPALVASLIAGVLIVAVLAGAYPAFVLSRFRPRIALKGSVLESGGARARQLLVVLQFAILIGLILTATVMYRQCIYATRDALHVDTDQILIVRSLCRSALLNQLRALPGVRGAFCSSTALLDRGMFYNSRLRNGTPVALDVAALEFDAFGLYGIKPVSGVLPTREPSGTGPQQRAFHMVINETAARRLGFTSPAAAIGQPLPLSDVAQQLAEMTGGSVTAQTVSQIVAVVPDFSFDVASQNIRPTVYFGAPDQYRLINLRLTGRDIPETLAAIDRISVATGAEKPLERFFLNEYIQNLYLAVLREAQAFGVFAAVALVLACLGLLGLAAATAESRTREIGIRKAMGAGTADILRMLLWQFSTPILWASLLGWPVSALLLSHWLDGFAYHVGMSPWPFLGASALALAIDMLTVIALAGSMARAKPVVALRHE
jgi:putative ABC transport system permease protein